MKVNTIFERFARAVLIVVVACNFLAIPDQAVSAKPLATPYDCSAQSQIPPAECETLVAFYTGTDGANWFDQTGWLQTDTPCSWVGVACVSGHVTGLDSGKNNLSGALPGEVGNLTELKTLIINLSSLTSIPPELGSLTNLQELCLGGNFTSIPPELGSLTNLQELCLGGNFTSIPPELGNLTNLQELFLGKNLTSIPPELGNLTNLTYLDLNNNQLTGPIPVQLGNLTKLTQLYLNNNALSGSIPTELGNLTKLTHLCLNNNQLTGPIPAQLSNLVDIQWMYLNNNALSGSIPPQLGSLTKLTDLYLNDNQLSGSIPAQLGNLPELSRLHLENNALSGPIPAQLGMAGLGELNLQDNALSGSIPPELGSLDFLNLENNRLTGSIPSGLGSQATLRLLGLSGNQLSGEFPTSITHLSRLDTFTFDCELTSSDPQVIAFIDALVPGWQNNICVPVVHSFKAVSPSNNLKIPITAFTAFDSTGITGYKVTTSATAPAAGEAGWSGAAPSSYKVSTYGAYTLYPWAKDPAGHVSALFGSPAHVTVTAPKQRARNGGFNIYPRASKIPTGWVAVRFAAGDGKSTTAKKEGAASLQIVGAPGKTKTLTQTLVLNGVAGNTLTFSFWARGAAIPAAGICRAQVLLYNGSTLKSTTTIPCKTGTYATFQKKMLSFNATSAFTKVVIKFTYAKSRGTVWFDAVSLVR